MDMEIHMMCHSHMDLGWLLKVKELQNWEAKNIYDSLLEALQQNKERKFILGNIGFLKDWYEAQTPENQQKFKTLATNGQIEFQNSVSVSSPDEATTYYLDLISNVRAGTNWFTEKISKKLRPGSSWMVDSFGHSYGLMKLQSQMGLKNFVTNRAQNSEKMIRTMLNQLVFKWQINLNGEKRNITSYMMPEHYNFKGSFFDHHVRYNFLKFYRGKFKVKHLNPMNEDFEDHRNNLVQFAKKMKQRSTWFKKKIMFITFGDDFRFQNSVEEFHNIENVINFVRSNNKEGMLNGMKMKYSNTQEFFKRVEEAFGKELRVKPEEDFFPLNSRKCKYTSAIGNWAGYFGSRPWYKFKMQRFSNLIRNLKKLMFLNMDHSGKKAIEEAYWWSGIFAHHDAITGTAKTSVMNDYIENLNRTLGNIGERVFKSRGEGKGKICDQWEIRGYDLSQGLENEGKITIFTSGDLENYELNLVNKKNEFESYEVVQGEKVIQGYRDCDISEIYDNCIHRFSLNLSQNIETLKIKKTKKWIKNTNKIDLKFEKFNTKSFVVENQSSSISTLLISKSKTRDSILIKGDNNFEFEVRWVKYKERKGTYIALSGTYTLSMDDYSSERVDIFNLRSTTFNNKYIIRADNYYGTIEIKIDKKNKNSSNPQKIEILHHIDWKKLKEALANRNNAHFFELTAQYSTQIEHNSEFYTDSNGLDLMKRVYRNTKKYDETTYMAEENYYPITKMMLIKDIKQNAQVGVYVDRLNGGVVYPDGTMEFNIQRVSSYNDNRGLSTEMFPKYLIVRKNVLVYGGEEVEKRLRFEQLRQENEDILVLNFDSEENEYGGLKDVLELTRQLESLGVGFGVEKRRDDELFVTFANLGFEGKFVVEMTMMRLRELFDRARIPIDCIYEVNLNFVEEFREVKDFSSVGLDHLEIKTFKVMIKK